MATIIKKIEDKKIEELKERNEGLTKNIEKYQKLVGRDREEIRLNNIIIKALNDAKDKA